MFLDESKQPQKYEFGGLLSVDNALSFSLAGLVSSHRSLPDLNPQPYVAVLHSLTDFSSIIGVSSNQIKVDIHSEQAVGSGFKFIEPAAKAIISALKAGSRLTSFERQPKSKLDVVNVQFPIPYRYQGSPEDIFYRFDRERLKGYVGNPKALRSYARNNQMGAVTIPDNLVVIYGFSDHSSLFGNPFYGPVLATHFYPALKIPGLDILRRLFPTLER